MGQHSFSDQEITEYLLGSVPETEELDELSVIDDEFAARMQAIENDLVDAYVRGELSSKAKENFDLHYLASPRRRARVLIAQGLKDILGPSSGFEHATEPALAAEQQGLRWESLRRNFFVPKLGLQMGLAAALLLLVAAGGWLALNNSRLRQQATQAKLELGDLQRRERELRDQVAAQRSSDVQKSRELADMRDQIARLERQATELQRQQSPPRSASPYIVAFALAPQRRSTSQIATIAIPASADYVVLHLELEAGNYPAYRAELKQQPANQVVWRSGKLRATDAGSGKAVVVTLRPGVIKAERHILDLSGISDEGKVDMVGSYLFVVTKP